MHPRAKEFIRHLPPELDVYFDADDRGGLVTVAYEGHSIAFYRGALDQVVLQVSLLVEVDPKSNLSQVKTNLPATLGLLEALEQDEGLRWTDHRVEVLDDDERESVLLLRLEGVGVSLGYLHSVLLWAWDESTPAIERSNAAKRR
jgi:hypothetical protein